MCFQSCSPYDLVQGGWELWSEILFQRIEPAVTGSQFFTSRRKMTTSCNNDPEAPEYRSGGASSVWSGCPQGHAALPRPVLCCLLERDA